jgi:hypothetical protein
MYIHTLCLERPILWPPRIFTFPLGASQPLRLRTETDPVSETSCCLEYRTIDRVQKRSNLKCYTPSSEPCRRYMFRVCPLTDFSSNVVWDVSRIAQMRYLWICRNHRAAVAVSEMNAPQYQPPPPRCDQKETECVPYRTQQTHRVN